MFRAFRRRSSHRALLSSKLFDERTFDEAFFRDLERARKSVIIESPYLTQRRARYFAGMFQEMVSGGVKIRINTRRSIDHKGEMRYQAEAAIKILQKSGIMVCTYNDMRHRKLAIIDGRILWEGSLNILSNGGRSREIMRRFTSKQLCSQLINFVCMTTSHQQ